MSMINLDVCVFNAVVKDNIKFPNAWHRINYYKIFFERAKSLIALS